MPSTAGILGLSSLGFSWEPLAAPMTAFMQDWFALQYLLPLISFVCVGLEGWCFFDLMRKTLGARSAARAERYLADARDAASAEEYDVVKDFPRGGFEPSNNQLCVQGVLGIKLHARHAACPSNPIIAGQGAKGLTMPCGCPKGRPQTRTKRRREMSYIAI